MARKHFLNQIVVPGPEAETAEPRPEVLAPRASGPMGIGVISRMKEGVTNQQERVKRLETMLASANTYVELDPAVIDPSPITDRLGDEDIGELVEAIRERGQMSPILVRPHPDVQGRYQIAFGHRRAQAAQQLGRMVKAIIQELSTEDLLVAQAQENKSRLDLSFIERATFAALIEHQGHSRDLVCKALGADRSLVSRMVTIAQAIPEPLIRAIGPARETGRPRWHDLADTINRLSWPTHKDEILAIAGGEGSSDERFLAVLQAAKAITRTVKPAAAKANAAWFKLDRKPGQIRIRFDEASLPSDIVDQCQAQIAALIAKLESNR